MKNFLVSLLFLCFFTIKAQTTSTALKAQIDTQITNKVGVGTLTKAFVGNNMKAIIDYSDQETIFKTKITIVTHAQILTMFSNEIEIIPAEIGIINIPTRIVLKFVDNQGYGNSGAPWNLKFNEVPFASFSPQIGSMASKIQTVGVYPPNMNGVELDSLSNKATYLIAGNNPASPNNSISSMIVYTTYFSIKE